MNLEAGQRFPLALLKLSKAQEARATEIHRKAIIVDGTQASDFTTQYFKVVRDAGVTVSIPTVASDENLSESVKLIAEWYSKIRRNQAVALHATTIADIKRAKEENKVAYVFAFQNILPLETRVDLLDLFHKLGIRMIQITYNEKNIVGDGCGERTDCGLSSFGLKVIERMNDLNMIVDLSHVGDRSTDEAIEASKFVVCSHANARSVCNNVRNRKDEQIKAIARKDGMIGVAAFPSFVKRTRTEKGELPTVKDLLDHIDYIAKLVGTDHVGIGLDFIEGAEEAQLLLTRPDIWGLPGPRGVYDYTEGIDSISKVSNITRGLVERGYSDNDILKILGRNWLRVLEKSLR
jgi:membrane dipeptidase